MSEHIPINVYEMPDESQEALLRRIEDGTAVLALRVCAACAPEDVMERIDDGCLDLGDGDALNAQWPCEFAELDTTRPHAAATSVAGEGL